jgi:hypothetical protein
MLKGKITHSFVETEQASDSGSGMAGMLELSGPEFNRTVINMLEALTDKGETCKNM